MEERVARILSDQIRSEDFLALERAGESRDLHARFGGDEFCFLIPDLPGCYEAVEIAERFKNSVSGFDWSREDRRLHALWLDVLRLHHTILRSGNLRRSPGIAIRDFTRGRHWRGCWLWLRSWRCVGGRNHS